MDQTLKDYLTEVFGKQRSAILDRRSPREVSFQQIAGKREIELEERAQEDRLAAVLDSLDDRDNARLREIESALERLAAGDCTCDDLILYQEIEPLVAPFDGWSDSHLMGFHKNMHDEQRIAAPIVTHREHACGAGSQYLPITANFGAILRQ